MTMKFVKRMLTAVLATTLVVGSAITVSAAPTTKSSEPAASSSAAAVEEVQEPVNPFAEAFAAASTPMSIGGETIKTDVAGAISIPKGSAIAGVAVRQSAAAIKTAAGLAGNEAPYVKAYEITAKKSPAAYASFNGAAAAIGATVLDAVNIDFGKMTAGKFSDLPAGVSVPTTIGVKNAGGRTLAVVKVLPGGATEILEDTDSNPNTVTFPITGGLAAYAVIAF